MIQLVSVAKETSISNLSGLKLMLAVDTIATNHELETKLRNTIKDIVKVIVLSTGMSSSLQGKCLVSFAAVFLIIQ